MDRTEIALDRRDTAGRWIGPAIVAVAGLAMLWRSWGGWPDPLIDFGRELYVPWRLAEGDVLNRDLGYLNGPLSPYFNAALFRIFGVGLRTLVVANLVAWALLLVMLYRGLILTAGRLSATVGCVVFALLFSFGQYEVGYGNYNYVCPYSHEMTHGLLLSVAALLCLHAWARTRSLVPLGAAGLLIGLVFLTKAEIFLAAAAASLTVVVLAIWIDEGARRRAPLALTLLAGAAMAPVAIAWALLARIVPSGEALAACLGSWRFVFDRDVADLLFYRSGMGLDEPVRNLKIAVGVSSIYGVVFLAAALVALRARGPRAAVAASVTTVVLVMIGLGVLWWRMPFFFLAATRPLSLFLIAIGASLAIAFFRQRPRPPASAAPILRIALVVFALALLLKMLLNVRVNHYGFVLAMPAVLVLVATLLDWVPASLARLGGSSAVFRSVALAGLTVIVLPHLHLLEGGFDSKVERVAAGRDAFRADRRGRAVTWALDEIAHRLDEGETLLVVPEGVMVNYLARRRSPTPHVTFMPPEVILYGESEMLRALRSSPPDYVLVVHKDTSEYGLQFFGRDYGQRIVAWIEESYEQVASYGAPPLVDERFGMELRRRAGASDGP